MLPSFIGICASGQGGGGCPAAGTYNSTAYGITYPVYNGGAYFFINTSSGIQNVPYQNVDVEVKNDGSCGVYYDYSTATNVTNKPYGTLLINDGMAGTTGTPVNVPVLGPVNPQTFDSTDYFSDGAASLYTQLVNLQYYPYGTFIVDNYDAYPVEVPSGSGNYYGNGKYDVLNWDGTGAYYVSAYAQGSFVPYGEFITDDGTYNYYWDGSGSYYSVPI